MNFRGYFSDQKALIGCFMLIMAFMNIVVLSDPALKIHMSSLLYIDSIAILIMAGYFILDFRRKNAFFKSADKLELGQPIDFRGVRFSNEEKRYMNLLARHHASYLDKIHKSDLEKKEWMEYMTSWFHEIKTPIAVSRMLFETGDGSKSLEEEMDRIEHFAEQALYFSRLNEFNNDYLIQELEIDSLVKELLKAHSKTFFAKKIRPVVHLESFICLTDKKALQFILNQLLGNSLKYTGAGGELRITVRSKNKTIVISDNGIGISPEDLPRIFEKGFTGKNGRKLHSSTGMGLYLAKKIADKLGHRIKIHSEKGSYTEACIHFPDHGDAFHMGAK
ncbi:sensor histidine kinase [Neobacillus notoginsengisoli]|uniref:histidine kinase n=1 Tax=Neobacillus notoginsengisoli TaxID=1578198 RepID=A0A417YPP9_9BACI|nr:sensor histidine kinase [Neobacillus notoginsengisoli]RHW35696.1 sensor histidine kinase [Neobacillus notoginsengisoli]